MAAQCWPPVGTLPRSLVVMVAPRIWRLGAHACCISRRLVGGLVFCSYHSRFDGAARLGSRATGGGRRTRKRQQLWPMFERQGKHFKFGICWSGVSGRNVQVRSGHVHALDETQTIRRLLAKQGLLEATSFWQSSQEPKQPQGSSGP